MSAERVAEIGPKVSDVIDQGRQDMVSLALREEVMELNARRLHVRFPLLTGRVGYRQSFFDLDITSSAGGIELIGLRPASPKYHTKEASMGVVVVVIGGEPRLVLDMYEYQQEGSLDDPIPTFSAIRLFKVDPDDDKVRVQPHGQLREPYVLQNRFQSPEYGDVRRGLRLDDRSLRIVAEGDDIMIYREIRLKSFH